MTRFLYLFTVGTILLGCALQNIKQPTNPDVFYKRDVRLSVNGKAGVGVLVVPKSDNYLISGQMLGQMSLVSIRSCHREWSQENVSGRYFTYSYAPKTAMETDDACILEVGGFDAKNGQHSWGMIAFEDPTGVSATVKCNGDTLFGKTTVCQSPAGLEEEISFDDEMLVSPDSGGCSFDGMPRRGKLFRYVMPRRTCVLVFAKVADKGQTFHRHYTVGYEATLLREN